MIVIRTNCEESNVLFGIDFNKEILDVSDLILEGEKFANIESYEDLQKAIDAVAK